MSVGEQKKRALEGLLARGDAMLCLDSRHPEVRVPDAHQGKPDLRLILNLKFRSPVRVLAEGVEADLRFQGELFRCWIPFESLWAVYNPQTGEGVLWPDEMPSEFADLLEKGEGGADTTHGPVGPAQSPPEAQESPVRASRGVIPFASVAAGAAVGTTRRQTSRPAAGRKKKGLASRKSTLHVVSGAKKD